MYNKKREKKKQKNGLTKLFENSIHYSYLYLLIYIYKHRTQNAFNVVVFF